jgi:DNA gyrase inhibitor GyrI
MTSQWHGGKGSARREQQISDEELQSRWDAIFNKNKKTSETEVEDKLTRYNDETREVKEKFSN